MTTNTGSLELLVRYKAGDNSTTVDFTKFVSYTKKDATPNVVVRQILRTTNSSNSLGGGSQTPLDVELTYWKVELVDFLQVSTFTGGLNGSISSQTLSFSSNTTSMTADIGKVTIPITFSDSEGTSVHKNVEVTVSRIKHQHQ